MQIATVPVDHLQVPQCVYEASDYEIEVEFKGLPHGADGWITCLQAPPHIDPHWKGKLFLTLSVDAGAHELGDAYWLGTLRREAQPVPPGTLFVIDPMQPHWLLDFEASVGRRDPQRWVGLQWEVAADAGAKLARRLVKELGGTWMDTVDDRYRHWRPSPGKAKPRQTWSA